MIYSVALDGPGGAGKSTIARRIAQKKGIVYVDTGAMYRAVALYMLKNGVDIQDRQSVVAALPKIEIHLEYIDGAQRVLLCGEDVSEQIRQDSVSMAASTTSAYQEVRDFLLEAQRSIARQKSVVMDGRDIGTVVLPKAQVKIFITRSPEVRAKRRYDEFIAKGQPAEYEKVLADIQQRDYQDSHRAASPLKQAEDAVLLDTSELDLEGATAAVERIIFEKVGK